MANYELDGLILLIVIAILVLPTLLGGKSRRSRAPRRDEPVR